MRCYKCNKELTVDDICSGCGTDVELFKKIVRMSNSYYNIGLDRARSRDLSGAAEFLHAAVRLYKKNTEARNLLGLIYFEMGDVVGALSEWVISKNIQPEDNLADYYIDDIQKNPAHLGLINQTIKKYNLALNYVQQGNDDLALIQLKKVLTLNPNLINGHLLLALLQMKHKEFEKAKRTLEKVLKIDAANSMAIRYNREAELEIEKREEKDNTKKKTKNEEKTPLSGNDVIIPPSRYRDINNGAVTIINVVIGILIGAAVVFFLVTPARTKAIREDYNNLVLEYEQNIGKVDTEKAELQKKIDELSAQIEELQGQSSVNAQMQTVYDNLIQAERLYRNRDFIAGAEKISAIPSTEGMTETFLAIYNEIRDPLYKEAASALTSSGISVLNRGNYPEAVANLTKAVQYDPGNPQALYNLAKAYFLNGDPVNADLHAKKVIELFPGTSWAGYAQQYVAN